MKRQLIVLVAALALSPVAIGMRSYASPAQHGAAIEPEAHGKQMVEMRKTMMEKMHASNAELDRLVADMNATTGDAKVAAMAGLLTRMVQQQTTMRQEMQDSMKTMMAQCPMMKDAGTPHEHKP
jgi:hypothetical protein